MLNTVFYAIMKLFDRRERKSIDDWRKEVDIDFTNLLRDLRRYEGKLITSNFNNKRYETKADDARDLRREILDMYDAFKHLSK